MKCKYCGRDVTSGASYCPHCGKSLVKKPVNKATILLIESGIIIVLVFILLGLYFLDAKRVVDDIISPPPKVNSEPKREEKLKKEEVKNEVQEPVKEPEVEPKESEPVEEETAELEFILPSSDSRYYLKSELEGLTKEELRLARNEIFARHGRRFEDSELQIYFESKSWYRGTDSDYTLNKYEQANCDLIVEYEKELGYR